MSRKSTLWSSLPPLTVLGFTSLAHSAETIQVPATPELSPDGKTVYFSWAGDIWSGNSEGGEARRITTHPAPDTAPQLSRNGKSLFFNSDRTGSSQVFQIPIGGGVAEQITFHSEGSVLEDVHPQKNLLLLSNQRDHAGRRPYRLIEKPIDISKDERVLFDATGRNGRYSPDGKNILFVRGGAPTYRKGYQGSQAARIWNYNVENKTFSEPVSDPTGCRYPLWAANGKSFYYVCARSGTFNIWQHRFGENNDRQLTKDLSDSVIGPAISADGSTLIYRQLFDFYKLSTKAGAKPERAKFFHRSSLVHPEHEALTVSSTKDATVTATGLEWAFIAQGEIWTMDTVLKEPHRLTDTPAHESDIFFSEKGDHLYYLKDNGITANYWRMSKSQPTEFWWEATDFSHEQVTKGPEEKWGFSFSPKGDQIAYIEYPGNLWIAKPDGSEARLLLPAWTSPEYVWSPDGKYMAFSLKDANYNSDICIMPTDGNGEPINVSQHPDNEYSPRWSPDGKTLVFAGRRHSTSTDLFIVHLNKTTHFTSDRDRRVLSAVNAMKKDPAYTEKEVKEGEEKTKSIGRKILKGIGIKSKEESEDQEIDFDGISKRIQRIKLNGLSPGSLHWMPDSKNMIFQSGGAIYRVAAKGGSTPEKHFSGSGSIHRYKDNDKLYLVSGGVPAFLQKGKLTKFGFSIPFARNREAHQRMGFRMAWRTLRDVFYDPALNNHDWDKIRNKYELAAAKAPTSKIFARVMAMLLGELNASHMGFYPNSWPKDWKFEESWRTHTAHLGMRLNPSNRVTFVHPDGPVDRPGTRIRVGEQITKINGETIRSDKPLTKMLTGRLDRDITIAVKNKKGESREITIRPISYSQARSLAHTARLDQRRETVEKSSSDTLGYLHVARMAWDEFEKFENHIYERGNGKQGLIIDMRDNGGGSTADHLLTVLTQPLHAYTVGRNGKIGYPQDRKVYASWNKPIVVLCNENSFSNAEIFTHAIKTLNRGKVIGIPTAGGVISTWSTSVLDLGRMRLPGRGWFLPQTGEDMELYGAVPHIIIDVAPDDLPSGKDPQLEKAIEILKQEVKEKGSILPRPIYRSRRGK